MVHALACGAYFISFVSSHASQIPNFFSVFYCIELILAIHRQERSLWFIHRSAVSFLLLRLEVWEKNEARFRLRNGNWTLPRQWTIVTTRSLSALLYPREFRGRKTNEERLLIMLMSKTLSRSLFVLTNGRDVAEEMEQSMNTKGI